MLAQRIRNMEPSATSELTSKVAELKGRGVNLISFSLGEPDFATPENICDAAKKAIDEGFTRYTDTAGILELREAIAAKLLKDNHVAYEPNEVIVSTGGKQALINAIMTLCDPGDEVLLPTPCWVSYIEMIKLAGSRPVLIPTDEKREFQLNVESVKRSLSPKTKAIILNSPNNPTGAVYSWEILKAVGDLAVEHNFAIISDEVYEKLVYEGEVHISPASFSPEIKERTVIINAMSKAYAMTGWRLGYAAGPLEVIQGMKSLQGHTTTNPNSIAQKAAMEALTGPQDSIAVMCKQYDLRRKYVIEELRKMEGVQCSNVKGAFYVMPNISSFFGKKGRDFAVNNSNDLAAYLLEKAHIAVVPGSAFEAPENIRISYATSMENIAQGLKRMQEALSILQ